MLALFLLQTAVIMAVARALGILFRRFGQPRVMGEMVAGIMLGPSLLGLVAPSLYNGVFPEASTALLSLVGQMGIVFFMFLVGLRLDEQHLRQQRVMTVLISTSSIVLPFVSGFALASMLYSRLSSPSVSRLAFSLFLGVCMSITAFPVLARILSETRLAETRLGSVALACAAANDATAWIILAAILEFIRSKGQGRPFWLTLLLAVGYVATLLALRPLLARWLAKPPREGVDHTHLALVLLFALASAVTAEWIGIHALFGAFLAGVVLPKKPAFIESLGRNIEPLTAVVLLPLFFALTGLRTRFGLAMGRDVWLFTLLIIAVAISTKWLGAMVPARLMGMNSSDANALGILMNTRGLIQLVILNIGLELGILTPQVFAMMVMMAVVTTFMAAPLLRWVHPASALVEKVRFASAR